MAKIKWAISIVSVALFVVGVLGEPGMFGLGCSTNGFLCNNLFTFLQGEFFLALSIPLIVLLPFLLFLRREVFMAWVKFAAVAFPIMLAILLYTYNNKPTPGAGGFGLAGLISDEMLATAFLPALFFIVSLIVIITKRLKEARARKQSL